MQNFESTIERVYGRTLLSNHSYYCWRNELVNNPTVKYLEVNLEKGDRMEVPCFAFNAFANAVENTSTGYANDLDTIIATLYVSQYTSQYKTLESMLKDTYTEGMNASGLIQLQVKPEEPVYYVSYGSVFDHNMKPIAIHSWIVEKMYFNDRSHFKYKLVHPLLRISPECFINKADSMQRFLSGRLTTITLNTSIFPRLWYNRNVTAIFDQPEPGVVKPKVLIEPMPYTLRQVAAPSITTSNSELLQVALNHLDEILQ